MPRRFPEAIGNVSRETLERLEAFVAVLEKWNPAINLVSKASLDDLWNRHIVDSAQLMAMCPDSAHSWVDIGSGGGFPGLVVAVIAAGMRPEIVFTLIESDSRKAAFLASAARETGVDPVIINDRIESAAAQNADVLSARALAPLNQLLGFAERHLAPTGVALFQKGETWRSEIGAAEAAWRYNLV